MDIMMAGKISKGWPFGMMLPLVACLWQIAYAEVEDDGYHRIRNPLPKLHMSAPEAFLGRYTSVAFYEQYKRDDESLNFQLHTFTSREHEYNRFEGIVKPRLRTKDFQLKEVRQVGKSTVVYMIEEYIISKCEHFRWIRLLAVDTETDNVWLLQHNILTLNPIIVPAGEDEFDLFIDNDKSICKVSERCRIRYNLRDTDRSAISKFDLELDWPTVKINRLDNGDLVATGFQDNTFKYILIDGKTYERHVLLKLENRTPETMKYFSKGLSICWTDPETFNMYECQQYSHSTKKPVLHEAFQYEGATISIYDIEPIRDDGGILVIAKKDHQACVDEDNCWTFPVKKIIRNRVEDHPMIPFKFNCTGDTNQLNIFKAKEIDEHAIEIYIGCRNNNGYFFSHQVYSTS